VSRTFTGLEVVPISRMPACTQFVKTGQRRACGQRTAPVRNAVRELAMVRKGRKKLLLSYRVFKAMNSQVQDRKHNHRKQFCGSKRGLKSEGECVEANNSCVARLSPKKPDGLRPQPFFGRD
jgi:hypothetical protein